MKKNVCIFIHFDKNNTLSYYVKSYVNELLNYFDDIVFVTNLIYIKDEEIKGSSKIKVLSFNNEGYDFGLFYKAINSMDLNLYKRLAFVNDSNVLFGRLKGVMDWGKFCKKDLWGITDSLEGVPGYKMEKTYHIQSHFLVFEERTIECLHDFFDHVQFIKMITTAKDSRDLRLKIISKCEMGITEYITEKGFSVGSMFEVKKFSPKYIKVPPDRVNMHIKLWKELIENGYPFIKKKIVVNGFDPIHEPKHTLPDFSGWKDVVKRYSIGNESYFKKLINI